MIKVVTDGFEIVVDEESADADVRVFGRAFMWLKQREAERAAPARLRSQMALWQDWLARRHEMRQALRQREG